jgi:oligopeptide/dipeptide ABC transporter ATP-binding protein
MIPGDANPAEMLLDVRGLKTAIKTRRGLVRAVDDVSFSVRPSEKVALVGESGCGKSMTARSVMRLLPEPAARIVGGSVLFRGQDLVGFDERRMEQVRGGEIGMVFQDPLTYLNPRMRIGAQIGEAVWLHRRAADLKQETAVLLDHVGLAAGVARLFPHELSGGMRQRVLIAIALASRPKLLIADEPTTALDVTLQAQILELLERLCVEFGMALILITHDMGVVAELCDRVYVMYAGKLIEHGPVTEIFETPRHPYTTALLANALSIEKPRGAFTRVEGNVPDLVSPPLGCRFRPRCPHAFERCPREPPMFPVGGVDVACWLHAPDEVAGSA